MAVLYKTKEVYINKAFSLQPMTVPATRYDVITSDFDLNKLDIIRRKRMQRGVSWTKGISFNARDPRFSFKSRPEEGPLPFAQYPTDMAVKAEELRRKHGGGFAHSSEVLHPFTFHIE